jgi:hypothetical protein
MSNYGHGSADTGSILERLTHELVYFLLILRLWNDPNYGCTAADSAFNELIYECRSPEKKKGLFCQQKDAQSCIENILRSSLLFAQLAWILW